MAIAKSCTNISFARLKDILCMPLPNKLREITYVANCTNFRRVLLNQYSRVDLNIDKEIMNNPDTRLTYLGYRKFLEMDLKHIFPIGNNRGSNQYKRDVKYLAKEMIFRGYVRLDQLDRKTELTLCRLLLKPSSMPFQIT